MTDAALLRALAALINETRNIGLAFTDQSGARRTVYSYDLAAPLRDLIARSSAGKNTLLAALDVVQQDARENPDRFVSFFDESGAEVELNICSIEADLRAITAQSRSAV